MRVIKRKISLRDFKTFSDGVLYGEFIETDMYIKVDLTQSGDDMGIFTDLSYRKHGDPCSGFIATLDITHITCFDPNAGMLPNTGAISIDISGGVAPYTVFWDFDGGNELNKIGLSDGDYTITVTDDSGCVINLLGEVDIFTNANPNVYALFSTDYFHPNVGILPAGQEKPFSVFPNPVILCEGETATLFAESGYAFYEWFNNGVSVGTTSQITIDVDGTYHVEVVDADGCTGESIDITIDFITTIQPVITASNIPPTKPDGSPQGAGTINDPYVVCPYGINSFQNLITLSLLNPTAYSSYRWNTGSNTSSIPVSIGGCYGLNDPMVGAGSGVQSLCDPLGDPLFSNVICVQFSNGINCIAQGQGSGGQSG
jgi:hypothetical protein